MANYFPLIADAATSQIKELPAGDFLDLSSSGIVNAGNITGTNIIGNGSSLSSITGANVTGTVANATYATSAGSATTAGTVTTAAQPNITSVGTLSSVSITGNITAGNLLISGAIIDSAQLDIQTSAGNANIVLTPNGTGNVNLGRVSASGNITAATYYGSGAGLTSITAANISGTVLNAANATNATNATNASLVFVGLAAASSAFKVPFADTLLNENGYYSLLQDSQSTFTYNPGTNTLTTGNIITGGSITLNSDANVTAIVNGTTNGVGNIGASGGGFNTVFAKATSAQYADLAEMYRADADYEPGTVLSFGGEQEVTISHLRGDTRVAGVVSTNPAHLMNSELAGKHVSAVALIGRVPTKVIGKVNKGDFMISAGNGYAQACADPKLGTVLGKAIENFDGDSGIIEVLINNH